LEEIGYTIKIIDDFQNIYLNNNELKERIEKIVDICKQFFPNDKDIYPNPQFIERFIHLFLNCSQLLSKPSTYIQKIPFEVEFFHFFTQLNDLNTVALSYKL